jgi:creatinine amidohydrolase
MPAALADLGAKRVILMTFHGAPLHNLALEAGVRCLQKRGVQALAPLHLILRTLLDFIPDDSGEKPAWWDQVAPAYVDIEDPVEREAMIRGMALDFHGGYFETSVLLHYGPEHVSRELAKIPPCPAFGKDARLAFASRLAKTFGAQELARELNFGALGLGWYLLRPFPGYTGRPHRANAKAGAYFARFIIDRYTQAAEAVFTRSAPAPKPIMSWVSTASFGGRAGGAHVPLEAVAPAP